MLSGIAQKYLDEFYVGSIREWAREEGYEYLGAGEWGIYGDAVDIEEELEHHVELVDYENLGGI